MQDHARSTMAVQFAFQAVFFLHIVRNASIEALKSFPFVHTASNADRSKKCLS
jgi:hypothetical protein